MISVSVVDISNYLLCPFDPVWVLERVYQQENGKRDEEPYSIRRLFIPVQHFEMEHIAPEGHGASLDLQADDVILIPLGKSKKGEFVWAKMVVNPLENEAVPPAIAPPFEKPVALLPPPRLYSHAQLFAALPSAKIESGPNWLQVPEKYRAALEAAISEDLMALTHYGRGEEEVPERLARTARIMEKAAAQWLAHFGKVAVEFSDPAYEERRHLYPSERLAARIFTEDGTIYELSRPANGGRDLTVTTLNLRGEPTPHLIKNADVEKIIIGQLFSVKLPGESGFQKRAKVIRIAVDREIVDEPTLPSISIPIEPSKNIEERFADVCQAHGFFQVSEMGRYNNYEVLAITADGAVYKLSSFRAYIAFKNALSDTRLWGSNGEKVYQSFIEAGYFSEDKGKSVESGQRRELVRKIINIVGRDTVTANRESFTQKLAWSFDLLTDSNFLRSCFFRRAGDAAAALGVTALSDDIKVGAPLNIFQEAMSQVKLLAVSQPQESRDFDAIYAGLYP